MIGRIDCVSTTSILPLLACPGLEISIGAAFCFAMRCFGIYENFSHGYLRSIEGQLTIICSE